MINTEETFNKIEWVMGRYNAENDCIPNAPQVTWTDMQLLEIARDQTDMIRALQGQLKQVNDQLAVLRVIAKIDEEHPRRPVLDAIFIRKAIDQFCTEFLDLDNSLAYRIITGYRPYTQYDPLGKKPAFYITFCRLGEFATMHYLQIGSCNSWAAAEDFIYRHSREQIKNNEKENHEL